MAWLAWRVWRRNSCEEEESMGPTRSTVGISAAPHRIPAVEALVAGAASHGDAAADVAGGGVGLHFGALLAEGVDDDLEAEVDA